MSIIQRYKNREQSVLNESCCGFQERWYYKVCSRRCIVQACNTNGNCSTGQYCGDSRKCTAGASDSRKGSQSESKNETGWRVIVGLVTPFTVVLVCLCVGCCLRKRKASRELRESICQRHENIQLPIRRTLEQQRGR